MCRISTFWNLVLRIYASIHTALVHMKYEMADELLTANRTAAPPGAWLKSYADSRHILIKKAV